MRRITSMSRKLVLKYIELETDQADKGPAWIARVQLSKSGRTVYFNGQAIKRGARISGNHFDVETRANYWVSGVKKNREIRHWAGSGIVWIEAGAVQEYLTETGATELDLKRFAIVPDLPRTDVARFTARENEKWSP